MASKALRKRLNKRSDSKPSPSNSSTMPASWPPHLNNYRKTSVIFSVLLILSVFGLLGVSSNMWRNLKHDAVSTPVYSIEVVNEFPHDPQAFTQGLLYAGNDILFESTGLNRRSSVRQVALRTGKVEVLHEMDDSDFGEGLTLIDERLFQVIWLKKTGYIYDRNNLNKLVKFTHQMTDGWGLATDGKVLFGSDGTSTLYKINPQTFKVINKGIVKFNGREVHNLNELEFINGEIWANVWQTDCIARISPEGGSVLGWILLPNLRKELIAAGNSGIDVLNGIAWDSNNSRIFVTGKLWPKLYQIKLHPIKKNLNAGDIEELCLRGAIHF
nr:glutaminyl-peptide cyclotransferase isoform X2 [Ziziphus jujuba var. spinosa]